MKTARKIYNIIGLLLPIAFITLSVDHGDIGAFILISSIVMIIVGIILVKQYDGPPASELRASLCGKPPAMVRFVAAIYGVVIMLMIIMAL